MSQQEFGNKIKVAGIWQLVLNFTVIGILPAAIWGIVTSCQILTTKWDDPECENSKMMWGLLGLFLLGGIANIVFGAKVANSNVSSIPSKTAKAERME